jgi:hypothetical protein
MLRYALGLRLTYRTPQRTTCLGWALVSPGTGYHRRYRSSSRPIPPPARSDKTRYVTDCILDRRFRAVVPGFERVNGRGFGRVRERGPILSYSSARPRHVHLEAASEMIEALFSLQLRRQLLFLFWRQQPVTLRATPRCSLSSTWSSKRQHRMCYVVMQAVIFYLGMSVHLANRSLPETASYYVRVTLVQN